VVVSTPALHDALADLVGREHLLRDPAGLARYAVDGLVPGAVVRPGSGEEVGRLLALCAAERLAVVPRGAGTAQTLGNPPRRLDLVVELARLAAVHEYVPEDMVATVGAGLTLAGLGAQLAPHRQRLALDPPGGGPRSVGGVLATNASGPLRFRYGTGRDLLLGARFVQADGTLTWGGAKVVKSVTGYDVPKLLVGSLGTLGILVEATLRLHPMPPATRSWQVGLPSHAVAAAFLAALVDSPLQPDRAALLDAAGLRRAGLTADPVALLLSIGSVAEAVEQQGRTLEALARGHGGRIEAIAETAWSALGAAVEAPVLLRLASEPRRLLDWAEAARAAAGRLGVDTTVLAQPGHGVLEMAVWDSRDPRRLGEELVRPLRAAVEAEGGSLVVERAPIELKVSCEVWGSIQAEILSIMKRIKREFDPDDVLSPGRFVGGL
jgi:glycolate oxidase FAD binding subunit